MEYEERIKAGREAAKIFGLTISDVALGAIYKAMAGPAKPRYQPTDFVEFYYGMGEMGFGEIVSKTSNGYRVQPFFGGKPEGEPRPVSMNDMRGLSTLAKAAEYERVRMGGK